MKLAGIIGQTLAILLFCTAASGQVTVERSKDKVVISGVTYYIHQIRKGETTYSISKAYNVTVEELTRENPPALYGIKEGQVLRIPMRPEAPPAAVQLQSEPLKHDDSKFIYHVLKPGETVYFLSRTYGVTEGDIVRSNPGIDISKLSVGIEVAVPKKEFLADRQGFSDIKNKPASPSENIPVPERQAQDLHTANQQANGPAVSPPQEKGFIYHKVENGESLSSIADKYGVSVRELRRANRDLRFPQVGDYVRVPGVVEPERPVVTMPAEDTVAEVKEEPVAPASRLRDITKLERLSGSVNVAVLLPFYLYENRIRIETDSTKQPKGKKTIKTRLREDDWIYPYSIDFLEMYEGILIAADTLRSLGLSVNLNTFDVRDDTIGLMRLINSGRLDNMDLIIGPVYSKDLALAARFGKERGIPVVSPVPLRDNSVLTGNPELFLASSTLEVVQKTIAEKLKEYQGSNFIFVHSDTLGTNREVRRFKTEIMSQLASTARFEDIRFREFLFYSRSMFNNDSINRLEHSLSTLTPNVVIIASDDPPVISETMIDIHSLSKNYDIKVFCYPELRDLNNLDPKYFFDLNLDLYSQYWLDYTREDVKKFNAAFRKIFLTEPTEKSYAWQGYDIGYYFMSGLALHGRDFIKNPGMHRPDLLESDFDFRQSSPDDGFENQNLFLIRYSKDFEMSLAEPSGDFNQ